MSDEKTAINLMVDQYIQNRKSGKICLPAVSRQYLLNFQLRWIFATITPTLLSSSSTI